MQVEIIHITKSDLQDLFQSAINPLRDELHKALDKINLLTDKTLSAQEVGDIIGCSRQTVISKSNKGELPFTFNGGVYKYTLSDIQNYCETNKIKTK